ncbi:glycosyltransferase family 2 protein [Pseudomonas sp. MAHUQ-62]|uniref:glycosyltransferase family 2 protein n=1 Tax=Pseudomonas sp. GCM10023245 TaxID=3252652 RepID=UPI003619130B
MRFRSVFAVVISYYPDIDALLSLVRKLECQVERVVVVDNGSLSSGSIDLLSGCCHFIGLSENFGIATAQNLGIDYCRDNGADAVVFFDQDSLPDEGLIDALSLEFYKLSLVSKVAAVAPIYKDNRYGFNYSLVRVSSWGRVTKIEAIEGGKSFWVTCLISSGSLISMDALADVGPMRDDLFIDYVDTEWCLRAQRCGYALYSVPSTIMLHSIGEGMINMLFWRLPVHSPNRRYFRVRNSFLLLGMPHVPVLLACREVLQGLIHQALLILTQAGRRVDYLSSGWQAVRDGLRLCRDGRVVARIRQGRKI